MSSPRVILIIGAGQRIGQCIASKFSQAGYEVALVARSLEPGLTPEGFLNIKFDLSETRLVPQIFQTTKEILGVPNIMVYNGAKRLVTPPEDPFSASLDTIAASRAVGFDSAYIAAQEFLRGVQELPSSLPKAFIFTGNALNQIAIPGVIPFAIGKVSAAMMIEYAANAYGKGGFKFYFTDERLADGRPAGQGIDGPAHGDLYLSLAHEEKQSHWLVTFTKEEGRKNFPGVDFDGNTREDHFRMLYTTS
ncbi:putative short chain type dehydrogenase [Xylariaceae sp. FL0255]|nr:putative short chain type dehydrogenase [Xylariaceae sp. FL0255]